MCGQQFRRESSGEHACLMQRSRCSIYAEQPPEGADALAHGCTGKGNDQVRFELTAAALAPNLRVIAPWRMEDFRAEFPGRKEMINYCRKHGVNVEASAAKPYSTDRNLLRDDTTSVSFGILKPLE